MGFLDSSIQDENIDRDEYCCYYYYCLDRMLLADLVDWKIIVI